MACRWLKVVCLLVVVGSGCDVEDRPDVAVGMTDAASPDHHETKEVTWHGEIAQIVATHCVGCHATGGVAPFPLDTMDGVRAIGEVALASMESGRMPPWQPDAECRTFDEERRMPEADIETFRRWVSAGMPAGDGVDERVLPPSISTVVDREPDAFARPVEGYLPDAGHPDDYRCFELDVAFDEDTFVQGTHIVPDIVPIVHHVLVYVVAPDDVAELRSKDEADAGPGYTCFGGPGVGQSVEPFAGWAPGGMPQFSVDGEALSLIHI